MTTWRTFRHRFPTFALLCAPRVRTSLRDALFSSLVGFCVAASLVWGLALVHG